MINYRLFLLILTNIRGKTFFLLNTTGEFYIFGKQTKFPPNQIIMLPWHEPHSWLYYLLLLSLGGGVLMSITVGSLFFL